MRREIWVVLVHYSDGTANISAESYTTYDEAVDQLCKRLGDGHWIDDFNFVTKTNRRYELKTIMVKI